MKVLEEETRKNLGSFYLFLNHMSALGQDVVRLMISKLGPTLNTPVNFNSVFTGLQRSLQAFASEINEATDEFSQLKNDIKSDSLGGSAKAKFI